MAEISIRLMRNNNLDKKKYCYDYLVTYIKGENEDLHDNNCMLKKCLVNSI